MTGRRILVVDDDRKAVEMVRVYLERDGHEVLRAYDGPTALELARTAHPALIVLDLMLPGIGGLDVCRLIRQESDVPVIVLSACSSEEDKLTGFDVCADDYVTKPFSPRELAARIRTVLRRAADTSSPAEQDAQWGPLTVSFVRHEALVNGEPVALTPSEFRILAALIREPGRAFTRQQLLEEAQGHDFDGVLRNVDVHIMNLRKKLGLGPDDPIKAVYGLGYKFEGNGRVR